MIERGQLVASLGPFDVYLRQAYKHPERSEPMYTMWLHTEHGESLILHLPLYQSPLPDVLHALYHRVEEVQKLRQVYENDYRQLQDPESVKSDIAKGRILPGASLEEIQQGNLRHIREWRVYLDELVAGIQMLEEKYPHVSAQDALIYNHGFPNPPSYEKLMRLMNGSTPPIQYNIGAFVKAYGDFWLHDVFLVLTDGRMVPTKYYAITLQLEDETIGVGALGKAESDLQGTVQQIKLCLLHFYYNLSIISAAAEGPDSAEKLAMFQNAKDDWQVTYSRIESAYQTIIKST